MKAITVIATGSQGSSVVRFLAKDGNFEIRVVAKDNNSSLANSLPSIGTNIKLFRYENLDEALKDAYGAFLVANYSLNQKSIEDSGRELIDAAVRNKVKHVIWSSDYDSGALSNGEIRLPKFDTKHDVEEYAKLIRDGPTFTFLHPALYLQNLYTSLKPVQKDGKVLLSLPVPETAKLSFTDIDEFGAVAVGIFNNTDSYKDADIMVVNGVITPVELASLLSAQSGLEIQFKEDQEAFNNEKKEIGDIIRFYEKFVSRDQTASRKLYPEMKDINKWIQTCGVNWKELIQG
ncbi:hypothetical protein AKO1_014968 [Acrasis kona]|uniref:NmrA-like domain-containing protein n=1 Tax=Acrasis kona TaxID=1008807 RepID=A0AAW2Z248_9EUKA